MVKREHSPNAMSTDTSASPPGSEYSPSAGDRDAQDDFAWVDEKPSPSTPKKKAPSTGTGGRSLSTSPKKPRTSPSKTPSGMASALGATSVKGHFAELIIEAGIQAVKKDLVESQTGLNPKQQHEMTRKDGKGSLRKALMAFAASL